MVHGLGVVFRHFFFGKKQVRTSCLGVPLALGLLAFFTPDALEEIALTVERETQTIGEGSYASIDVALTSQPDTDVTVRMFRSSTKLSAPRPLSLKFSPGNWSTPQTVRWKALSDDDADDEKVNLTFYLARDHHILIETSVEVEDDDLPSKPIVLCDGRLGLLEPNRAGEELDICWKPGRRIPSNREVVIEARRKSFWDDPLESFSPWREIGSGAWYSRCGVGRTCAQLTETGLWRGFAFTVQMRMRRGEHVLAISPELQVQAPNSDSAELEADLGVVEWSSAWGERAGRFAMKLVFADPLVGVLTTERVRGLEASDFKVSNGIVTEAAYWDGGAYKVIVEPEVLGEPVTVRLPAYTVKGVGEGVSASGGNNYTRYNRASNVVFRQTSAPE